MATVGILESLYEALSARASVIAEFTDWLGFPVKVFELGDKDKPPVVLIGGLEWECLASSETLLEGVLRYEGDVHVIVIPCVNPSFALGLEPVMQRLLGTTNTAGFELLKVLAEEGKLISSLESAKVYAYGNLLVVAVENALSMKDLEGILLGVKEYVQEDYPVLVVGREGISLVSYAEGRLSPAFLSPHLREVLEWIKSLDPLLIVLLRCCDKEKSIRLPSSASPSLETLAGIAGQHLGGSLAVTRGETLAEKIGLVDAPVAEICLSKAEEKRDDVIYAVHAILGSAYLLR